MSTTKNLPYQRNSDRLLTEVQATEFLDLRPGTLCVWRSTKRHNLPFIKVGRNVRYRERDLAKWLESRISNDWPQE